MQLADFLQNNASAIADGAEAFAATQAPRGVHLDPAALRDHLPQILDAVIKDLRTAQDAAQQQTKAEGLAVRPGTRVSAARSHGRLRAKDGFSVDQMVSEYRALRAAVIRLWAADEALGPMASEDMIRFNEAIDQAVAESVADFSIEAESWRQVFLGVLGHDLRQPLGVIVMTSELMALMTKDTPFSEQTDRIIRSGKRMSALLDDLLDYSRTSLGMGIRVVRTERDLQHDLLQEIELLRHALPHVEITFETDGPTNGAFDASRMREALANLVSNAAKYGKPGANIRVCLKGHPQRVDLVVANEGSTLSTQELKSLFEPLKRGGNGTASVDDETSLGLGLFIVREIAKAHGGDVSANSLAKSTTFTVRIPKFPPDWAVPS